MIRTANSGDIERIARIWLASNVDAHNFIEAEYWEGQLAAVRAMLPRAELYVFEQDGEISGFIGLDGSYIAGIFVALDARSGGIGRQLLNYGKSLNKQLWLKVYQKNARAVKFYQREGFAIQSEAVDEDTGEKEYLMKWRKSA